MSKLLGTRVKFTGMTSGYVVLDYEQFNTNNPNDVSVFIDSPESADKIIKAVKELKSKLIKAT